VALFACLRLVAQDPAQNSVAATQPAAPALVLTGSAGDQSVVTATERAKLPHITVTVFNAHIQARQTYSGVPLGDLLTKVNAPFGEKLHGRALGMYVVAEGADHYSAVYSLAEVDPSFHPGTVLVADTLDGKPLPSGQGPLQVINTEDKRPARWVRNLVAVRLALAQ
jgi:hypothetical protein